MGRALSLDLRERLIAAYKAGLSRRAVAQRFAVSMSCMVKLVQHWQRTGDLQPKTPTRRKPYALAAHEQLVRTLVAAQPSLTLDELRARLQAEGIVVGRSSVARYRQALDLTLKKSRCAPPSRSGRMSSRRGRPGAKAKPRSTRHAWSSSMRPG